MGTVLFSYSSIVAQPFLRLEMALDLLREIFIQGLFEIKKFACFFKITFPSKCM